MNISKRDRRFLIAGLAVVVLAAGFYMLFLRGGGDASEPVVAPPAAGAPAPSPSESPAASKGGKQSDALVFSGRDPFQPLVSDEAPAPEPTVSPAGTPPPAPSGGSSITIDGHTVVLLDLFTQDGQDMAQVEVDGTVYTAKVGETFAQNFTLQSVNGGCADFLYGDQSFSLCESTGK
jgi:hypothetical protein